jgi:hypothetical protein
MKPKTSTLALKSDEPPVLIPIEQQIQQRAYELYEQRGRTDGRVRDKGHAGERRNGIASWQSLRAVGRLDGGEFDGKLTQTG